MLHIEYRNTHSPSQIIGSIVNTWPDFITPTALFSEIKRKSQETPKPNSIELNSSQEHRADIPSNCPSLLSQFSQPVIQHQ